jgi:roadblock/LC7 domain-containing protein
MKKLLGAICTLTCITQIGCMMQPPPAGPPGAAQTSSAQLPGAPEVRDALIACGAGMRSGVTAELTAAYDKNTINGKITADAWRAIEAAFLKYVPAADQKDALANYEVCVARLAGKYVEPNAIPTSTTSKQTK